jgi:catechol 2,3-dioxygenase-like lactoylglutathione lyase family enzyme
MRPEGNGKQETAVSDSVWEVDMKLTHSCIITENVERLREFYKGVLQIEPQSYGDDYVEFPTEGGTLSLFSLAAHEVLAPGSARSATNRSLELEFEVADVDREYERLQEMEIEWVKPPTTQPWGSRSIYFRDPDGNLTNFYSPVDRT